MLIVLIGEGKMHKLILPQVPSGNYVIDDKNENTSRRLIEIASKDGKWQLCSDYNAKILNPKCTNILNDKITINKTKDLFISRIILKENSMHELMIGDSESIYILCCFPVYEDKWFQLSTKHTKEIFIGKNEENHITFSNPLVANTHAKLLFYNDRWMVENYDKKYGTFVNGNLVDNNQTFLFNGDTVFIMGLRIILMGNNILINNPAGMVKYNEKELLLNETKEQRIKKDEERDDKFIELYSAKDYFHRAPRTTPKIIPPRVKIEPPPSKKTQEKMPLILTIGTTVGMGIWSGMYFISALSRVFSGTGSIGDNIMQLVSALAMALCTLLIPLYSSRWQKKKEKEYEQVRQKKYTEYMANKKIEIENIKNKQKNILYESYATAEECMNIILKKDKRLWERTYEDSDFLTINLGVGDIPLNIDISYPEKAEFSMEETDNLSEMMYDFTKDIKSLKDAPVTVSLANKKVIAYIDKNEDNVEKFMQNIIIQLMTFQSYHDLKFVFLLKKDVKKKWDYVKMFPYVWNDEKDFRFFEDDIKGMEEISKYLEDELQKRVNQEDNREDRNGIPIPHYLIITDDYRKIENLGIINKILDMPKNIGFSIFCITNNVRKLPNECKTFITIEDKSGTLIINGEEATEEIHFNFNNLTTFFLDRIRKTLANIPIKYKLSEKNSLPTNYSFLEMYNVGLIEQLNILERWKNNDATLSLAAPIGIRGSGKLINLDIHEKAHGPHGLVAGSTGSGKSEFIITYILSLAINYHPDDVAFILIDYKGGGLSGVFEKQNAKLPHLVGTITNIDKEGLQRSLVSIHSELKKRQVWFNEARDLTDSGVIDIYKYQKLYHTGVLKKPIPHLLIICDEFAELKQQQPEFMEELVSVSRIGRSLGVHLILATQKPSGVVDEQIRSNSKFSICLKVQDKADSSDVIDVPDAAYLKQSGRFYIKVGNGDYFDLGQSGWSGAKYYPSDTIKTQEEEAIKFISNNGTVIKQIDYFAKKTVNSQGEQLPNIIKYIADLANQENIKPKQLWLDDIPEKIYIEEIKNKYKFKKKNFSVISTIGEYDDPANQKQGIVSLDFTKDGNVIIYGNAESGKETLISTIVYDLITSYTAKDIWLYLLDFGTETLKIFQNAPQVGDIMFIKDVEKINRFFSKIKAIANARKQILSEYNGDYNFFIKTSGKSMPLYTIILNGYDNFIENYSDIYDDTLLTLTREGAKTGIVFVFVTTASNDLRYRLGQNFKQKIALSLNDSSDYSSIFENIGNRKPAYRFGRGLVNLGEIVYEFQTAKPCEPEDYNIFIKSEIEKIQKENKIHAERIKILPTVVKKEDFDIAFDDITNMPVGLRTRDIEPETYDFKNNPITIISAKDEEEANQFAVNIWRTMSNIKDIQTICLDPKRIVLSGKNDLKDNFAKIAKNEELNKFKYNICFILGLDRLANFLEDMMRNSSNGEEDYEEDDYDEDDEDGGKVAEIIEKSLQSKKISFIIVDNEKKMKEHKYDKWYSENVIEDNIMWVGNDIEGQYLFDVNAGRKETDDDCGCCFGYINKKSKTIMIKLLEMKEKRDNDE